MTRTKLKTLYSKVGGEGPLKAILADFYDRMAKDILIGFFFDGKDPKAIAEKQFEFLLVAMGIQPCFYGKGPVQAHLELPPILKGHFERRLVLLRETLKDHQVGEKEIKSWIAFERAFEKVIVKN